MDSFKAGERGSVLVIISLTLPIWAGLVGLAIDGTMCFIVQTELSAAVDGAALGAGRLLSTAGDPTAIANQFLNANFRVGQQGFWNSYNLTSDIDVQTGTTKSVTVTAQAFVPLLFMRILRFTTATVSASATATRRDARIIFIIDRSGSMDVSDGVGGNVMEDVKDFAQSFTQQFTNGYDEMGLVVFGRSAVVGYPTTPWPATLTLPNVSAATSTIGGPDTNFHNGATDDMVNQIGRIQADNGTAMGDALRLAYLELQKAHLRAMHTFGKDTRMNAVVLFTDGVPAVVTLQLNRTGAFVLNSGSGCTYRTDPTHPIYGNFVLAPGTPPYKLLPLPATTASGRAVTPPATADVLSGLASEDANASHNSHWYMSNPIGETPALNAGGCNNSWSTSPTMNNLDAIPQSDKYGRPLTSNGVGYLASALVGGTVSSAYNGTPLNFALEDDPYMWGLVAWNQADQAAEDIRADANYTYRNTNLGDTSKMATTIYTVGYTGNGGTDYGLLQKIANVSGSTANGYSTYNNTQLPGIYAQASDKTALANAFSTIATAILRLAH